MRRICQRVYLKRISGSAEFVIVIRETRDVAPPAFPHSNRVRRCGCYRPGVASRVAQDVAPKLRQQHPHGFESRSVLDGTQAGKSLRLAKSKLVPRTSKRTRAWVYTSADPLTSSRSDPRWPLSIFFASQTPTRTAAEWSSLSRSNAVIMC